MRWQHRKKGWLPLGSVVLTNTTQRFRDEASGSATQRFYRVRESR